MGKAARRKKEQRRQEREDTQRLIGDAALAPRKQSAVPAREADLGDQVAYDVKDASGKSVGMGYQFAPDENGDVHMERLPIPRGTAMTTSMVANLSRLAREQAWCSKALTETDLARLDPAGLHMVLVAWKHTTLDWKRANVRVHLMLKLRGQREPHERMVDFPSWHFGVFLSAVSKDGAPDAIEQLLDHGFGGLREAPRWASSRSFAKVWDRCQSLFSLFTTWQIEGDEGMLATLTETYGHEGQEAREQLVEIARSPRALLCATAFAGLQQARLIVAEPEWVQGIDDTRPGTKEVFDWLKDAHLPFDCLYLDFEGPGGNVPSFPLGTMTLTRDEKHQTVAKMSGALVRKMESGGIEIIPCVTPRPEEGGSGDLNMTMHEPAGRYVFHDATPPADVSLARVKVDGVAQQQIIVVKPSLVDPMATDGRIEIPLEPVGDDDGLVIAHESYVEWARMVHIAAMRAARMLYMLQAASNVELVEAKLTREGERKVKRAVKRGWPIEIGMQVAVRWRKKLYFRPPGIDHTPEGTVYSHAHWRIGHPNYYPLGTRMADALAREAADKLVMHPEKGPCRMVWHPPTIVGKYDEDGNERVAVEKSRKIIGPAPPDVDEPPTAEAA